MAWQLPEGMDEYLKPTKYCDSDNLEIKDKTREIVKGAVTPKEVAIRIFHFVRDHIKFALDEHTKASETLKRGTGQCVTKTGLQIALLRAAGIPARYHLADLHKNCLKGIISQSAFEAFDETITDHPWCECYLSRRWVSCDTLFDKPLYEAGVEKGIISIEDIHTIEWDGEHDLNTMTAWILADKGTAHSIDDIIERDKKQMASFWPVLRESNQHTSKLRKG